MLDGRSLDTDWEMIWKIGKLKYQYFIIHKLFYRSLISFIYHFLYFIVLRL